MLYKPNPGQLQQVVATVMSLPLEVISTKFNQHFAETFEPKSVKNPEDFDFEAFEREFNKIKELSDNYTGVGSRLWYKPDKQAFTTKAWGGIPCHAFIGTEAVDGRHLLYTSRFAKSGHPNREGEAEYFKWVSEESPFANFFLTLPDHLYEQGIVVSQPVPNTGSLYPLRAAFSITRLFAEKHYIPYQERLAVAKQYNIPFVVAWLLGCSCRQQATWANDPEEGRYTLLKSGTHDIVTLNSISPKGYDNLLRKNISGDSIVRWGYATIANSYIYAGSGNTSVWADFHASPFPFPLVYIFAEMLTIKLQEGTKKPKNGPAPLFYRPRNENYAYNKDILNAFTGKASHDEYYETILRALFGAVFWQDLIK